MDAGVVDDLVVIFRLDLQFFWFRCAAAGPSEPRPSQFDLYGEFDQTDDPALGRSFDRMPYSSMSLRSWGPLTNGDASNGEDEGSSSG
jgi:hypothetical protein